MSVWPKAVLLELRGDGVTEKLDQTHEENVIEAWRDIIASDGGSSRLRVAMIEELP